MYARKWPGTLGRRLRPFRSDGRRPAHNRGAVAHSAHEVVTAYIGLGSNLGNRKNNISKALQNLARLPHTTLLKTSSLYNSSAIGPLQRDFVNCIARIATSQSPPRLLDNLNEIERRMGRRKK